MTLSFSAEITVDARDKTGAIYDSVHVDNEFYPENPVKTSVSLDGGGDVMRIRAESGHLAHLRANLNSTLRLVRASYDSIESVKI